MAGLCLDCVHIKVLLWPKPQLCLDSASTLTSPDTSTYLVSAIWLQVGPRARAGLEVWVPPEVCMCTDVSVKFPGGR